MRIGDFWRQERPRSPRATRYTARVTGRHESIALPLPGIRAARWTINALYRGIKEAYAVSRIELGRTEWFGGGRRWESRPGELQLKQPDDIHRDIRRDGICRVQLVVFDTSLVDAACRGARRGRLRRCQLEAPDPRGAAFHRLHAAIDRRAEPFALEVAAAEALSALAAELTGEPPPAPARPVQRAIEMLRDHLTETITLDAIAEHAGLDKFHLSRAFRDQVGLPPHAYRTHLRVQRAKQLLAAGVRPSTVALRVGFYDQSQLHRHFRRLVGTTPGEYWRASRRR